jgi:hypothetical protein
LPITKKELENSKKSNKNYSNKGKISKKTDNNTSLSNGKKLTYTMN